MLGLGRLFRLVTFDVDFEEFLQWEKGERQSGGIIGKKFQAEEGARGEGQRRTGAGQGWAINVSNTPGGQSVWHFGERRKKGSSRLR